MSPYIKKKAFLNLLENSLFLTTYFINPVLMPVAVLSHLAINEMLNKKLTEKMNQYGIIPEMKYNSYFLLFQNSQIAQQVKSSFNSIDISDPMLKGYVVMQMGKQDFKNIQDLTVCHLLEKKKDDITQDVVSRFSNHEVSSLLNKYLSRVDLMSNFLNALESKSGFTKTEPYLPIYNFTHEEIEKIEISMKNRPLDMDFMGRVLQEQGSIDLAFCFDRLLNDETRSSTDSMVSTILEKMGKKQSSQKEFYQQHPTYPAVREKINYYKSVAAEKEMIENVTPKILKMKSAAARHISKI